MDYAKASNEELEQLANNKDGEAICELGERCMYGTKGHERNLTKAYQMFHKGEKLGLPRAYLGLAEMYKNGIYFAKNDEIADEYYQKANVSPAINVLEEITVKINQAEDARKREEYFLAKEKCNEALRMLDNLGVHQDPAFNLLDISRLRAEAYWLLAYVAFNEQQLSDMEAYLSKEGVLAQHPWGRYLMAVAHQNSDSSHIVMEQDLQALVTSSQNANLSMDEKGDIFLMIAELVQCGYGERIGYPVGGARTYYEKSAQCGNQYASGQLAKFY